MTFGVFPPVLRPPFHTTGAAAVTPYSLFYDRSDDYVNCGTNASLLGLNAGAFTCDVYWRAPDTSQVWALLTLVSQGTLTGPYSGWAIHAEFDGSGNYFRFAATLGGVAAVYYPTSKTLAVGSGWYYVRLRKTGVGDTSGNTYSWLSYNAVGQNNSRSWAADVTSATAFLHGMNGPGNYLARGNICYVHVWATDQGVLASVPTTPFAVDANTRGRWLYTDGAGSVLTDSSSYANNGTIYGGAAWQSTVPAGWTI